ncbi:MAG: 50S ribosomal protein L21 [bacterium]
MEKVKQDKTKEAKSEKLAVIKTGGKQYVVKENDVIEVELIEAEEGKEVIFTEVLLFAEGDTVDIGQPILKNVQVRASYNSKVKGEKQIIFKYKAKKNYRVKTGHRQKYSQITINKIEKK